MEAVSAQPPFPDHDRELRAAWAAESRQRSRRGAIAYCLVAVVVIVAAVPLDHLRFPELTGVLLRIRLGGVAALAVVAALLASAFGQRHPRALALLAPSAATALLLGLAFVTGHDASPFNVSINFALLGVALLIPWPAAWSVLACLLVLGGYVVSTLVAEGPIDGVGVLDNLTIFFASSGLTVLLTRGLEQRRWREFAREWALALAHRESRASAERYRSVVETAGSMIVILSPIARIIELNREAERVLGWPRDQAIGRDFLSLCVTEPTRATVAGAIAGALAVEPAQELEARLVTAGGGERVAVCNLSRLADGEGRAVGVIVCAQDITERKRMEQALRESESRMRTVVANSPMVLFTLDRAGVITLSEGRGLARVGLKPGAVVGMHITEVVRGLAKDPTPYAGYFTRALAGETVTWVSSVAEATFECRLTPMPDRDGRVGGVIGVALDVTDHQRAEEARLELERKLLEAQKLESLGLLAGGVAHDFSNLLVSVLGNVDVALAELPRDSPARVNLQRIETAARRGSELTRQMLAYAGKGSVMLERVDLNAVVEETSHLLQVSMGRGVSVHYDLGRDLSAVEADPTQIGQVVMNLVLNAAESVGEGSVTIAVRTRVVEVSATDLAGIHHAPDAKSGPHVLLEVEDTGCGMDAATLAKVFDPFFTTKVRGRGLGLATVLGVVRAHGGALDVTSTPGHGTTFRILLPCRRGTTAAAEVPAPPPAATADEPEGRTILLVDDEEDVRAITAHMLERLGCSVLVAGDGREGVEVFRSHAQTIDAVIVDLTLPRLSGERAIREIRDIRPDACVILMSGYDNETASRRLGAVELAGFLRKPFSVADLRSTMGRALAPPAAG